MLGPDAVVYIWPIDYRNNLLSVDPSLGSYSCINVFFESFTVFLPLTATIGSMLFTNGWLIYYSRDRADEFSRLAFRSFDLWCLVTWPGWPFMLLPLPGLI